MEFIIVLIIVTAILGTVEVTEWNRQRLAKQKKSKTDDSQLVNRRYVDGVVSDNDSVYKEYVDDQDFERGRQAAQGPMELGYVSPAYTEAAVQGVNYLPLSNSHPENPNVGDVYYNTIDEMGYAYDSNDGWLPIMASNDMNGDEVHTLAKSDETGTADLRYETWLALDGEIHIPMLDAWQNEIVACGQVAHENILRAEDTLMESIDRLDRSIGS